MMKYLVAVICLTTVVTALDQKFVEEFMEKMQKIGEQCNKEVGATSDDIADLMAHKIPSTQTGKCMIFCFHKHFHVQNEDGSIDKEGAIASLDPLKDADADLHAKVVEVFKACGEKAKVDSDPCITAANLAECAIEEGKARGIDETMFE